MKAFHNDIEVQNKYLARVLDHAIADEIIKGQYWTNGKGCAVGCTIHSSNHSAYETELGVPQWLARLEDTIFEGLSNESAKLWPVEFLAAINIGADLDKIKVPMLIFIVEEARQHTTNEKSLAAIDGVLVELKRKNINHAKLAVARNTAYYAAATADAAYAAAYAADYATADAAYAAADAAYAAAYAAYYYAYYAADTRRMQQYEKFANKLIELIRDCK